MARRASNTGQKRIKRNLEAIMPLTKQIFSLLKYYVIGVAIILTVTSYIAKPVVVRGTSMNPTLNDFDICISNRLSIVLGGSIDRFDIVVAQSEEGEIVKRVVGIPGDTISYKDGVLTVNGSSSDWRKNWERKNFFGGDVAFGCGRVRSPRWTFPLSSGMMEPFKGKGGEGP